MSPASEKTTGELNEFWKEFYQSIFNGSSLESVFENYPEFSILPIENYLVKYVLNTGLQIADEAFQQNLVDDKRGFHTIEEIRYVRKASDFECVRKYLLVDCYPRLQNTMDLKFIGIDNRP